MTVTHADVLGEVASRVDHLRADTPAPGEGWLDCDAIGSEALERVIDSATEAEGDRQVTASLLAQSYAHRVTSISLASYAAGLPWPQPSAAALSVRLADGRARTVHFRDKRLGEAADVGGLVQAVFEDHLYGFMETLQSVQRLGQRLIWANVASSCASAFRAIEGAARDRGDVDERLGARKRAMQFFKEARRLHGTGSFVDDEQWLWQRTACCLWYRTSGGRLCQGCSLRNAPD